MTISTPRLSTAAMTLGTLSLALSLGACKKIESEQGNGDDNTYVIETEEVTESADGKTRTVTITRSKDGSDASASTSSSSASASASSSDGESLSLSFNEEGINLNVDVPEKQWTTAKGSGGAGNGEGLYPGTQVTGVNVNSETVNGKSSGQVRLNFTSPAAPDIVADYMVNTIRKKGGKATRKANTITATQTDGDNYTVTLEPADGGKKTQGTMVIGKNG